MDASLTRPLRPHVGMVGRVEGTPHAAECRDVTAGLGALLDEGNLMRCARHDKRRDPTDDPLLLDGHVPMAVEL